MIFSDLIVQAYVRSQSCHNI